MVKVNAEYRPYECGCGVRLRIYRDPASTNPRAYWLARNCGDSYHDFLQDEPGDRRTAVMAEAINDGFGTRFEPLVVLSEMLGKDGQDDHTDQRSQYSVVTEMLSSGYFDQLRLYGLALPAAADPEGAWAESALILTPDVAEDIE